MAVPDESTDSAPAAKSKKMLIIIIGLLVLLAGGGAGAWFFMKGGAEHKEEEKAPPPKVALFLPLETFTVNLQGGEQYLQVDITLQASEQEQIDAVTQHMPRVRSRLLSLLSSQDPEILNTTEGKQTLTKDILAQINQPFAADGKPQKIEDVLFTSFVIQ